MLAEARFCVRKSAALMVATAAMAAAPTGLAAQEAPKDSTMKQAGQVVSQPVRDVGLEKTSIPPLLIEASNDPYGMNGAGTCGQIATSISALNRVLGADYSDTGPRKRPSIVKAGGQAVVNSLIPFRGIVREVSGAAPAERRLDAAVSAGFARRGFLHGLARGRNCR